MEKPVKDVTVPYFVHEGEMARMERINRKSMSDFMDIMDELMEALQVLQPKLYAGVIRKIKGLAL